MSNAKLKLDNAKFIKQYKQYIIYKKDNKYIIYNTTDSMILETLCESKKDAKQLIKLLLEIN